MDRLKATNKGEADGVDAKKLEKKQKKEAKERAKKEKLEKKKQDKAAKKSAKAAKKAGAFPPSVDFDAPRRAASLDLDRPARGAILASLETRHSVDDDFRLTPPGDHLFDERLRELMKPYMPHRFATSPVTLLYSLKKHGVSLRTFYNNCEGADASFMVVEDQHHWTFGVFLSEAWRSPEKSKDDRVWKGTGETFLFTVRPDVKVFPWTSKNNHFLLAHPTQLSFGSGGDGPGLWLDADLHRGTSKKCDTFENCVLASTSEFGCLNVEVWGVAAYK